MSFLCNINCCWCNQNISRKASQKTEQEKESICQSLPVKLFSHSELVEATRNFDPSLKLGRGGFGTVYLGQLDGSPVAIKRHFQDKRKRVMQFMNEVEILSRLRHQNLVRFYGCTSEHNRELLLVYEYVPNGTLADHLHGPEFAALPWLTRVNIAIDIASALAYLHASDIIHRDIKCSNILLGTDFTAKVADFGFSRLYPPDVSHVTTDLKGTPGYLDPEYYETYQLTDKSDVYSFGVVLFELISSLPAVDVGRLGDEIKLVTMAMKKIQLGALQELVDPCIRYKRDFQIRETISLVAELAFQCVQEQRDFRPTMEEVLETLKQIQEGKIKTPKAK